MSTPDKHPDAPHDKVRVPEVKTTALAIVGWGVLAWLAALAVLLLVPGLPGVDRGWWVWVPVAGMIIGGLAYAYLRRGRGMAAQQ